MRRQGGNYGGDSGADGGSHQVYGRAAGSMHQPQESKSGYYQGRHQEPLPSDEKAGHQLQNQRRWEREGPLANLPQTPMSPTAPFPEDQGHGTPRSYYQSQRMDPRLLEKQGGGGDPRSQTHEEDMDIGYEDDDTVQTFEALEQRFLDDIMKLSKEQTDAEDAENARHRARINVINAQYEEQLAALRARHASQRKEFLQRESQARQQQYQQIAMEQYANRGIAPSDPNPNRMYNTGTTPAEELHRAYNSDHYHSYREHARFTSNVRDYEFEHKTPYPTGRAYGSGTGSRYY